MLSAVSELINERTYVVIFIWFKNMSFTCLIVGTREKWIKKMSRTRSNWIFSTKPECFISLFHVDSLIGRTRNVKVRTQWNAKTVVCERKPPHIRIDRQHRSVVRREIFTNIYWVWPWQCQHQQSNAQRDNVRGRPKTWKSLLKICIKILGCVRWRIRMFLGAHEKGKCSKT